MRRLLAPLVLVLLRLPPAAAHGGLGAGPLETRFTLPWWVAWVVGAFVVALSYAVVAGFVTRPRRSPPATGPGQELAHERGSSRAPLRILGLAGLVVVGLHAFQPGDAHVVPAVVVWLLTWGLLPMIAYTVGNPWPAISPLRTVAAWADRSRRGRQAHPYPDAVGRWPSVALVLLVIGLEPLASAPGRAWLLGAAALAYAAATFVGAWRYGSQAWLANAEVFERVFAWWASIRPWGRGGAGPVRPPPVRGASDVAFTVALLYGVNFDGFLATPPGRALARAAADTVGPAPAHATLLVAGFLVFLGLYMATAWAIRQAAPTLRPVGAVAVAFAASLLPIAAAYHLAHNALYVVENAPLALSLLADPIGLGVGVPGVGTGAPVLVPAAALVWVALAQMAAIVVGHVGAVVAAHALAWRSFPSRMQALRAELPLTLAMVAYTLVGLWIVTGAATGVAL